MTDFYEDDEPTFDDLLDDFEDFVEDLEQALMGWRNPRDVVFANTEDLVPGADTGELELNVKHPPEFEDEEGNQ